jgi:hypothetical protein
LIEITRFKILLQQNHFFNLNKFSV